MSEGAVIIRPEELHFLLFDWLNADQDGARELLEPMLEVSLKLAETAFLTCAVDADNIEPEFDGKHVRVLPAIADALNQYKDMGLFAAGFDEEAGGLGLSHLACSAMFVGFAGANISASAFALLTTANARLILNFGTKAQIEQFASPQIEGRYFGTMCLSEPQAGSSLGDILTRAQPDGEDRLGQRFRLSGNKMWISGGDQNVSENIVNLVLAKEPGPNGNLLEGTRGISLFIVPKFLANGATNDVSVAGLNHKLGYRGIPNCLLNFGENEGAVGWRVGEAGMGLRYMFQMMNEARISVGLGAAALAYRGYMHSLNYAQERMQGRAIGERTGASVAIIEHADVKAMLLRQKIYAEGALALTLYCADLVDKSNDVEALALLDLLTPIAKSWPSEFGLMANDLAIQVLGGYGYTREFDAERLWRDNRLNAIHEGTTGIQAQDLLGRKLLGSDLSAFCLLKARVKATCQDPVSCTKFPDETAQLQDFFERISDNLADLSELDPATALDNATWFLRAMGHGVVAWLWLDLAVSSSRMPHSDFLEGKRKACRYFFASELPQASAWLDLVGEQKMDHSSMQISQF